MNSSYLGILVNKSHPLPDDYVPPDLVPVDVPFAYIRDDRRNYLRKPAALALENMFRDAAAAGMDLTAVSGYRSFERQREIYESNLAVKGPEHTRLYSAEAGKSEHQTGLAMDISTPSIHSGLTQTLRPHRKVSGSGKMHRTMVLFSAILPERKASPAMPSSPGTSAISGKFPQDTSPPGESLWKNIISFYFRRKSCMI